MNLIQVQNTVCLSQIAHSCFGTQVDGTMTFVSPLTFCLKSDHLSTSPASPRFHVCDISLLVSPGRTQDHRLRLAMDPWRDCLTSKVSPHFFSASRSCSCQTIRQYSVPFNGISCLEACFAVSQLSIFV